MRWDDNVSAAENIRTRLPKRFQKYVAAGTEAFAAKNDWEHLHHFRIQTKRMRYTLELFPEYFGPRFGELIDRVRRVQTLLGEINDLVSARRLLKTREDAVEIRDRFRDKARRKLAKARTYWGQEFDDEAAGRWVRYLRMQARAKQVEKTGT